jgi:arginine/lysine/ornithine decarboxylase
MNALPYLKNKAVLKDCRIFSMLQKHAKKRHVSFHTPGHKRGAWDITELSFSDNLSAPQGVIAEAEKDIAKILGAYASFILTDGSTAGVMSMLYAAKELGVKRLAVPTLSHKSVFNACNLLGIAIERIENPFDGVPLQPTLKQIEIALENSDGVLLTTPDYYGNIADLQSVAKICREHGKLFLADGAHGGHLHFDRANYAGEYADFWVDGVHKSLPCYTQGAVVSARTQALSEKLAEGVDVFRTTSPSYPIMASVEYAVKYPRNVALEERVLRLVQTYPELIRFGGDWTKVCVLAKTPFEWSKALESRGIYAEFCDGNAVMFYLSPATTNKQLAILEKALKTCAAKTEKTVQRDPAPLVSRLGGQEEWLEIPLCEGRICARVCGLFPPCTPLLVQGERISKEKLALLASADNLFGVRNGKICVVKEETEDEKR